MEQQIFNDEKGSFLAHAQSSLSSDLNTEADEVIILDDQPKNITKGFQHQKEVSQIKKESEIYVYTLPCLYQSQNMSEDNSQQPMFEIAVIPEHIVKERLENILSKTKF